LTLRRWVRCGITRQNRHAARNVDEHDINIGSDEWLVSSKLYNIGSRHEVSDGNSHSKGAPRVIKRVWIRPRHRVRMAVHDDVKHRWVGIGGVSKVEQNAHGCRLGIGWHIEHIPACGLAGKRELSQVDSAGARWLINIQGIVAKVAICKRAVECHVVPHECVRGL
jgi:hypothetical protein